ncbi:MAG: hypothetical protein AAF489_03580 [Bacteroidota bacterium]
MEQPYRRIFKFKIESQEVFDEALRISLGKFSIGHESLRARNFYHRRMPNNQLIPPTRHKYDADNNYAKFGYHTLINVNMILCWMFYEGSGFNHTVKHVKKYLENLTCLTNEVEAILLFEKFIKAIRPHLTGEFKKYNYRLNDDYKFKVTSLDEPEFKNLKTSTLQYPKKLSFIPMANPENIIGREWEIEKLRELLAIEHQSVLIRGISGLGKTTLAKAYVFKYFDKYEHVLWLSVKEVGLVQSILENTSVMKCFDLMPEDNNSEEVISEFFFELNTIGGGDKLLVVDNAKVEIEKYLDKALPGQPDWDVIFTSTKQIEGLIPFQLELLSLEDCKSLFKKYCLFITEEKKIETIVQRVDRHTLVVELLAKTAERLKLKYEDIIQAVGLDLSTDVKIEHSGKISVGNIRTYVANLFNISELSEQELWMLKQFTCLPSDYHSYMTLKSILYPSEGELSRECALVLEKLFDKGWLLKDADSQSYKLHKVIEEVIGGELSVTVVDVKFLIKNVKMSLYFDEKEIMGMYKWIPYAETLIGHFDQHKDRRLISPMKYKLAFVYDQFGEWEKSTLLLKDVVGFFENTLKISDKDYRLSNHYNDVSQQSNPITYSIVAGLNDHEEKLTYLEKYREGRFANELSGFARSYYLLGKNHSDIGNDSESRKHLIKAKLVADHFLDVLGTSIDNYIDLNYVNILYRLGDYEEAVLIQQKVIEDIKSETMDEEMEVSLALRRFRLSRLYLALDRYDEANELASYSINTCNDILGEGNAYSTYFYTTFVGNLARKGYEEIEDHCKKAIELATETFGENHLRTKSVLYDMALALINDGKHKEGIQILIDLLDYYKQEYGIIHFKIAVCHHYLAQAHMGLKEFEKAKKFATKANNIVDKLPYNPRKFTHYNNNLIKQIEMVLTKF